MRSEIADRATVLRNGKVAGAAAVADLTQRDLVHMISGTSVKRFTRAGGAPARSAGNQKPDTRPCLPRHQSVCPRRRGRGPDGLEGSGPGAWRAGCLVLRKWATGYVTIDGKTRGRGNPSKVLNQGLAYLPRDRHGLGLVDIVRPRQRVSLRPGAVEDCTWPCEPHQRARVGQ